MNPRFMAIRDLVTRKVEVAKDAKRLSIKDFGNLTFNKAVIQRLLPKNIAENLLQAMEGKGRINPDYADQIAKAMKDWSIEHGATHYCHWFQPMTGLTAEKHDAFIDWKGSDTLIETFTGKQLIRGEPDASSFPSGGLRSTHEARGYTSWDPTSSVFLWKSGGSNVLCIPSVFFSWTGIALDLKIPLLRSDAKINQAALRLTRLLGIDAKHIYSTLGCEQEYFLIDRSLFLLRPDLMMAGRTVYGAQPPKGQELEDHYFGAVKERVLNYMREFEETAFALGIPLKTRHNEVAPAQHEVAPVFEKASIAVDHNILLMELMRQIAVHYDLSCLIHEKPFAGINGSGKHNNWSLSTDTGINLLDPTDAPGSHLLFLIMLTAVLSAVHKHSLLLRASIASAGNDHRLGGNEAPPVIISVYLGEALEKLLKNIENQSSHSPFVKEKFDLRIPALSELPKDNTDRNRTSPFAFTGNKFEFRAVGASMNCAFPVTVINVIVAESLNQILDEIESGLKKNRNKEAIMEAAMPILRKYLKASRPIRFSGNNYSSQWEKEAKLRGLPIVKKSYHSFSVLEDKKTIKVFEDVLSEEELVSRYEIMCELYSKVMNIETKLMVEMFNTQILPSALEYQKLLGKSIKVLRDVKIATPAAQAASLKTLSSLINQAINAINALEISREKAMALPWEKRGKAFCDDVGKKSEIARGLVDEIEKLVDDRLWTLPKYRELLFMI